ncbi:MAG TPA: 2OG-Fe(II) oxygenase [Kiloniellaceae bacterium]|nr:2OG-Fe(II) oxygenase [Kiloniellaceae bacterium]
MASIPRLEINDFLPRFQLLNQHGRVSDLFRHALGKPILLAVLRGTPGPAESELLRGFAAEAERLAPLAHLMMISDRPAAETAQLAADFGFDFPVMSDEAGQMTALLPQDALPPPVALCFLLTDANRRVLEILPSAGGVEVLASLAAKLTAAAAGPAEIVRPLAPVLYLPRVLDPAQCRSLIELYHSGGNTPTGIKRSTDEQLGGFQNKDVKIRRDHVITDPARARALGDIVGKRVVPEIFKAFSFRVKYVKEFKIGRYGADDKGFFRPHRDNYGERGGRRFAMSLNLNSEDYEGGNLTFPEYGPALYRPGSGDAVVFSCYLVHEALPVTRGARYVLLTFFYGEEGEGDGGQGGPPPQT